MMDILEFWSQIKRGETVHPADREVFARINPEKHGFQLDCLPASYGGKLKTAPVVFLFSSPGYSAFDLEDAQSEQGKETYADGRAKNHSETMDLGKHGCLAERKSTPPMISLGITWQL
jgi:hypothetical protein